MVTDFGWPPGLHATRLLELAPELTREVEDWEVLIALSKRGGCDGFITNDRHILLQPAEMYALSRTHLALVVADGVGHEPFRATGLVLLYIEQVANRIDGKPRTFVLRPSAGIEQKTPNEHINRIAEMRKVQPRAIIAAVRQPIDQRIREP